MTHKPGPSPSVARLGLPAWLQPWGLEALLVAAVGLALYFWIGLDLLYQNAGADAFNLLSFSPKQLLPPGQLFSRLLAWGLQACQIPALGAVLWACLIWLICRAAASLFWRGPAGGLRVAHWLLAPPLLAGLGRYDEAGAALVLGWGFALGVAAAVSGLRPGAGRVVWRWWGAVLGAGVVYLAGGGGPLWACGLFSLLAAGLAGRLWAWDNLVWPLAMALGVGMEAWFFDHPWPRWFEPWVSQGWVWPLAAHAFMFALVGVVAARLAPLEQLQPGASPPDKSSLGHAKKKSRGKPAWPALLWLAGVAIGVALMMALRDDARRATLQLRALAVQEKWPEFLALARQQTHLEPATRLELALALYYTGNLLEDWFAFPVVRQEELLPNLGEGPPAYSVTSRAMLALGQVNHAERFAAEALEILGPRPELLLVLAQVNVLKGHPVAAGNFLRALQQQPFQRATAARWLAELSANSRWEQEPRFRDCRALMVATDYPHPENPTSPLLQQLLHTNPTNRMALEFLLAHYLVSRQLDKAMEHAERLRDPRLGYAALPRHLAEAALLWSSAKQKPVDQVAGFPLPEPLRQRFARFDELARAHAQNLETVRPRLAAEFGDTYWYFYLYGRSGRWNPPPARPKP